MVLLLVVLIGLVCSDCEPGLSFTINGETTHSAMANFSVSGEKWSGEAVVAGSYIADHEGLHVFTITVTGLPSLALDGNASFTFGNVTLFGAEFPTNFSQYLFLDYRYRLVLRFPSSWMSFAAQISVGEPPTVLGRDSIETCNISGCRNLSLSQEINQCQPTEDAIPTPTDLTASESLVATPSNKDQQPILATVTKSPEPVATLSMDTPSQSEAPVEATGPRDLSTDSPTQSELEKPKDRTHPQSQSPTPPATTVSESQSLIPAAATVTRSQSLIAAGTEAEAQITSCGQDTQTAGSPKLQLSSAGLNPGAIAGIVCGGVVAIIGIILFAICVARQWKHGRSSSTGRERIEFVEEQTLEAAMPGPDNRFPESQPGLWYDTQATPVFNLAAPDEGTDVMTIV
jgi:hypothetical protein